MHISWLSFSCVWNCRLSDLYICFKRSQIASDYRYLFSALVTINRVSSSDHWPQDPLNSQSFWEGDFCKTSPLKWGHRSLIGLFLQLKVKKELWNLNWYMPVNPKPVVPLFMICLFRKIYMRFDCKEKSQTSFSCSRVHWGMNSDRQLLAMLFLHKSIRNTNIPSLTPLTEHIPSGWIFQ